MFWTIIISIAVACAIAVASIFIAWLVGATIGSFSRLFYKGFKSGWNHWN